MAIPDDDDEIIQPCNKPFSKKLVLASLGDHATHPEDSIGGYDPHVTFLLYASPGATLTQKETKAKSYMLNWIHLHLH